MSKFLIYILIYISISVQGQSLSQNPLILYGSITQENLADSPFRAWYKSAYDKYVPHAETLSQIRKLNNSKITITAFLGTWCGDSKREVPRFLKLLDAISFPESKLKLIAVGNSDSLYKQSPQHEERGIGIYRVPTFIFYKDGIEINRITEYPVVSLEKDVMQILGKNNYNSNFHSFPLINQWLKDKTLDDDNSNPAGLANQLRYQVSGESELNSLGYLFLDQKKFKEAVTVFRMNYSLYPQSANVLSSLGEGYLKSGDAKNAVVYLERALLLNKDPLIIKEILELIYEAKRFVK